MQLQPEELGQIDIKLKLNEGKLIIDILAANSKTQALLTNQVDKLIASMGLQNVQVESVNVSQQMNHQGSDGQNQWQNMNFDMDFSQRRNQEQLQKELSDGGSRTGVQGASQIEAQETGSITTQNLRQYSNLHRLNYAV
jgi:flagellar hook-length control protein FliK